ncbi:MAG: hypothetical protein WC686_04740 [Candidatus Shapirobacteria bacterium]|jgi:type II secretory pathway pseudopilin PulG
MRKNGFTLIELVISAGVMVLLMVAISGILLGSFKARMKVNVGDRIQTSGDWVLGELRKNVLNARTVECLPTDSSQLMLTDDQGLGTTLLCSEAGQKISSVSATRTIDLTNSDVQVTNCINFALCDNSGSKVGAVDFNFVLSGGSGGEDVVKKEYRGKVTIR